MYIYTQELKLNDIIQKYVHLKLHMPGYGLQQLTVYIHSSFVVFTKENPCSKWLILFYYLSVQ